MPIQGRATRLESWKEIAAYLRRTVRTVQRWEAEGLPVHRQIHSTLASVYADSSEIDAWQTARSAVGPTVAGAPAALRSKAGSYSPTREAHEFYVLSRHHWSRRTVEGLEKSIRYGQLAIDRDPAYAPGYSALAQGLATLASYTPVPPASVMPQARVAATRALELDPDLAEAHCALGLVQLMYDWNWQASGASFERAIHLRPSSATAHQWLSFQRLVVRDHDAALSEIIEATVLDPLSSVMASHHGWFHCLLGRPADALTVLMAAVQLDPLFFRTHLNLAWCYLELGRPRDAADELRKAYALNDYSFVLATLAECDARGGEQAKARAALAALEGDGRYTSRYGLARAHAWMDTHDRAFELLADAIEARESYVILLGHDPVFDPIRSDLRFKRLMRRIGLPDAG